MKKFLLIPTLLIAAVIAASAHCGSCDANEAHEDAAVEALPAGCDKACCMKDSECDKAESDGDKAESTAPASDAPAKSCCPVAE